MSGSNEPKFEPEEVIEAIEQSFGRVTQVAAILECNRETVYQYCKRFPEIQKALDKVRADREKQSVELAQDALMNALWDGKSWAVQRVLDRLEPQEDGLIDPTKLTKEQLVTLHTLLELARPKRHKEAVDDSAD
jgi:hypothetical protein